MARLRIIQGNDEGKVFELPAFAWVIGRGSKSDVLLDDPRSSREHACIRLHHGKWMVRDLGTPNGTFVNRAQLDGWQPIQHADEVRVGHTLMRFEDEVRPASPPSGGPGAPKTTIRPLPDQVEIPGYRVYDKIGDGATGSVYRARQLSLDRLVAIKVLSPALAKKAAYVERFEREARAAAELSHDHVVPVYGVGHHKGLHYFTMELMAQGTVEDRLLDAPGSKLPWPEAVALISDAANGLAHVHQHGLVHRDIKPDNLLLDDDGCVKLGDLGTLVREADAQGVRIGTPHFMSPEQARRERVTRASDVYSLGATLYRMLTGTTPHKGENVREIVRAVAFDKPHPIEALREGLPRVVADEINAMMSRDPAQRPVDAGEVGKRLAAALQDVHAGRQMRRRDRRRKATSQDIAIRVVLLAVVGGALFALREPIQNGMRQMTSGFGAAGLPPAAAPLPAPAPAPSDPAPAPPEVAANVPTDSEIAARYAPIRALDDATPALPGNGPAAAGTWRSIAQEYEEFVDLHPLEAREVLAAHRRARSIRDQLAVVDPIDPAVAADVDRRLTADLETAGAGTLTTGAPDVPSLRVIRGGRPDPLRDSRTETLRGAQAILDDGLGLRTREAFAGVIHWVRDERERAGRGPEAEQALAKIDRAVDWLRHAGRLVATRLATRLDRDDCLLALHMRRTAFFCGLDGLADPSLALARLDRLEIYTWTEPGRERCRARRAHVESERATWSQAISSGASPRSVADEITKRSSTLPRELVEGAVWLLLETGQRYRAEELLAERRLPDPASADLLRIQFEALRELATMGKSPDPSKVIAWSKQYPTVDLALVGAAIDVDGVLVIPEQEREAWLDAWGSPPPR